MPTTLFNPWHGFPSQNVVYVDFNYLRMRGNGQLAYPSMADALAAWRVGGQAQVLWGTPTATNRGVILVGVGTFTVAAQLEFDVNFLSIIGLGNEISIFAATTAGFFFHVTQPNVNFKDIWINGDANTGGSVVRMETNGPNVGVYESCKISSAGGNFMVLFQTNAIAFSGVCKDCEFVDAQSTPSYSMSLDGGAAQFIDCTWTLNANVIVQRMSGGTTQSHRFIDCQFTGASDHMFQTDSATFNGVFIDCILTNTVGKGLLRTAGTFAGRIENCLFECANVPIDGLSGVIKNCTVRATGTNINAIANAVAGMVICANRVIGTGTGVAVQGGALTLEATGNQLRMPTGDVPGSSMSVALINSAATPFNSELIATTVA